MATTGKRLGFLLVAFLTLVLLSRTKLGTAMPADVHGWTTGTAVKFFLELCEEPECEEVELKLNSVDQNEEPECVRSLLDFYTWRAPDSDHERPAVVAGAFDEDGWHVLLSPEQTFEYYCDATIFAHHAWDPDINRGWVLFGQTSSLNDTGLEWANFYFYWALEQYWKGETARAYYLLGRAIHLLGDAATPAHAHGDPHLPIADQLDGYEDSLDPADCDEFCPQLSNCGERLDYTRIRTFDDFENTYPTVCNELKQNAANYFDFVSPVSLAETLWTLGPDIEQKWPPNMQTHVDVDLFHIFYIAAETADDFPSEGCKGEDDTLQIDDPDTYTKIGEKMVPVAVQSTVALLELFWDRTHSARPLTPYHIVPLKPGEQTTVYLDVQNVGPVVWEAGEYVLQSVGGELLGADPRQVLEADVPPGRVARWELPVTAPSSLSMYSSEWQMKKDGLPFSPSQTYAVLVIPDSEGIKIEIGALLQQWLHELLQQLESEIDQSFEELTNRFEEWLQRESERLLSELLESLSQQCCGAAMIAPGFLLLVVWTSGRRRRKRMGDRDRE